MSDTPETTAQDPIEPLTPEEIQTRRVVGAIKATVASAIALITLIGVSIPPSIQTRIDGFLSILTIIVPIGMGASAYWQARHRIKTP